MPPLIALAGALGGVAALRWALKGVRKINAELDELRARRLADETPYTGAPTLQRDPTTGAYRPSDRSQP